MLNFEDPKDVKLAKKFLRSVWKASYVLSIKRPETTVQDIIRLLHEWIVILERTGISKPK